MNCLNNLLSKFEVEKRVKIGPKIGVSNIMGVEVRVLLPSIRTISVSSFLLMVRGF